MTGSRAAQRYAKATLSLASDKNVATEVNNDMSLIGSTIKNNSELRAVLKSPVIKETVKKNVLTQVFSGVNGVTSGLFGILLDNGRVDHLLMIATRYNELYDEMKGIQVAHVTTAIPLTPELEAKVQTKVKQLTGNTAKIKNKIDESIIGGFILRVGDLQYNASVAAQLNSVKRELYNDTYITKI